MHDPGVIRAAGYEVVSFVMAGTRASTSPGMTADELVALRLFEIE